MLAAANSIACCPDPHLRSIVVDGVLVGYPAASHACRPRGEDCSPAWLTQPTSTSSTAAGSMPLRSTSPVSTWASSSTGCSPASAPLALPLPIGLRTASMITAFTSRLHILGYHAYR